jgi:lipooligosaccharide transport system permease protein
MPVHGIAEHGSRAPSGWRAILYVVEGLWIRYRRNWRVTAASSVLQPLLYLLAFGAGLGGLVDASGAAVQATGGVSYLRYLAPALLVVGAAVNATSESTYPILSAFKGRRTYWAVSATPITPGQLVGGQLTGIALRLTLSATAYLLMVAPFGAVRGPGVLAALFCAVLCGMAFSAPLMAFAATWEKGETVFAAVYRFVVLPMVLFSGTFFPISRLPWIIQPLVRISPLWHGTELARGAALGTLRLWPAAGHLAYLTALLGAGTLLSWWRFRVRLTR